MEKNVIMVLVGIAVALLFVFKTNLFSGEDGFKSISSTELKELIKSKKVELIDVRTKSEIDEGYIKGTKIFIDYNSSEFDAKTLKLDKSKTYAVYCKSGGRSSGAAKFMAKNGFTNVLNLKGGITGWDGEISK